MNHFQSELDEKKAEAEQMLQIISEVSKSDGAIIKTAILKSAFVLLLYNMIESTAFLVFERVHEKVAVEHYTQLGTEMRKVWVDFFFSSHPADAHHEHLEKTLQQKLQFPLLENFMNRIKLFSGNLDARKIDDLLFKYGIGALKTPDRAKLVIVKNRRNAVAHGEEMFKEACRDLSDSDLEDLKNATFSAMEDLIEQAGTYLNEKKYLAAVLA
ncbi:MAE_28990/MAE_18760 family HEPN-like nuclease [Collimonas pratensis]|nr:MAE_28990/MAE_18760 family HEPN-like nuclease [Collimonas pratensis]